MPRISRLWLRTVLGLALSLTFIVIGDYLLPRFWHILAWLAGLSVITVMLLWFKDLLEAYALFADDYVREKARTVSDLEEKSAPLEEWKKAMFGEKGLVYLIKENREALRTILRYLHVRPYPALPEGDPERRRRPSDC